MNSKCTYPALTIFIVLSLCIMVEDCFAIQWAKTYGGAEFDSAQSIQQTTDEGHIVAGVTQSFGAGGYDMWILKLDTSGIITWQKTYGGDDYDWSWSIQQTTDGGYITVGETFDPFLPLDSDMQVLKLDSSGNVSWQKRFHGGGGSLSYSRSIQQTRDGGYIVAGEANSFGAGGYDVLILKLDSFGNVSWQNTYGGSLDDIAPSIQQTTDRGFIVAGYTESFGAGGYDMWILKLDTSGIITWQKTYGGSSVDQAYSIQQTTDGGFIVAGYTESFGAGDADMWILKLDSFGNVSWQKTYGGIGSEGSKSIQQTVDGGYIAAGSTNSFSSGDYDLWVLKFDTNGTVSWQKTYGGIGSEGSKSIEQTTDGGYIVAGSTNSFGSGDADFWTLKLDYNGNINNCDIIDDTTVTGDGTNLFSVADSAASISTPSHTITDTTVTPQASTAEIETQCFVHDWFPTDPPTQDELNGVWGYISSALNHEFYAVGEEGTIIHFDGTSWSTTLSPTSEDLNGVWGSSETNIFVVGDNATIFRYGGEVIGWEVMNPPFGFNDTLKDVWGSAAYDVYAVGVGGTILHYDGNSSLNWSLVNSPTSETLTGIWGSSSTNYVAVGEGGTIVTINGNSWTEVTPSPTTEDLSEVWGSGSNNIYVVGKGGTLIHYVGNGWNPIPSPTAANLRGIWGSSSNNIFVVGEHGTILYYDGVGVSWTKLDSGVQDSLLSTFGTLNPRVMVVGYDGNILSLGGPSVQGKICNACTGAGIDAVTVEFDKSILGGAGVEYQTAQTDEYGIHPSISSQGGPYPLLFTATDYLTKEITVDLPFNSSIVDHATYLLPDPGYQGCVSGTIKRTVLIGTIPKENNRGVQNMEVKLYPESSETESTVTDVGGNYHLRDLPDGTYSVEPVIVGSECTVTPLDHTITVPTTEQYDFELTCPENPPSAEAYWEEMVSGTNRLLHGIWGSSGSNIFAVGDNGVIINYDGSNWSPPQTSGTTNNLKGVWGSSETAVYAAGEGGTVLKTINGGTSWTSMTSNAPFGLNAIWGSSASDMFAVGDHGTIIHGDGTSWTLMDSGTEVKLLGVWGTGTDVYAVGNSHKAGYWKRTVIKYNGNPQLEWTEVPTGNGVTLMSPWGTSSTDITAAGSFGSIMRYKEWVEGEGPEWKQIGGPTEKTLNAMWGSSGSNIFAVGYNGVIAHYDGATWTIRETETPNDLYGICGIEGIGVFAVGDHGKIFAYTGDVDGDGEPDATDNCTEVANDQTDNDSDGHGDACDNCPDTPNEDQAKSDYDTLGNACDNCPLNSNEGQEDTGDGDGVGDVCDNCPVTSNPNQENNDHDGEGDVCDTDDDNDGIPDTTEGNEDPDLDSIPNWFDTDSDGDGVEDSVEAGSNPTNPTDTDIDGTPDYLDDDSDDDTVLDDTDNCRLLENPVQEDSYPPLSGNNCGDACECEGNFDGDLDVDGTDASTFKADFGRSSFKNPCNTEPVCNGNFECDLDVDGTDAATFKEDFGRSSFKNPCPSCPTESWCVSYPE